MVEITGRIILERVADGSKSERETTLLETDNGHRYILRRLGGNAMFDQELANLVGSRVGVTGNIVNNTLIIDGCKLLKDDGNLLGFIQFKADGSSIKGALGLRNSK